MKLRCRIFGHKNRNTSVNTEIGWLIIRRCKRCNKCRDDKYQDYKYEWMTK